MQRSSSQDDLKGPDDADVAYQGLTWRHRALEYDALGAVLDPADSSGRKNRYIDRLHRLALRAELERSVQTAGHRFQRALDFGCGEGRLLDELVPFAASVVGVDPTPEMEERARKRIAYPTQQVVPWHGGPLPFEEDSFDLFISVYVTLTTRVLEEALHLLPRVCKPGARGIFLEQVDSGRGLTLDRYVTSFGRAGFEVDRPLPIRKAVQSNSLRFARTARWPSSILDILARLEMRAMRDHPPVRVEYPYVDYLFALTLRTT